MPKYKQMLFIFVKSISIFILYILERRLKLKDLLSPEEQREYCEKNQGLIYYIIDSFHLSQSNHDDLVSAGNFGLYKATITFDRSKKIHFATYATKVIQNEILMQLRRGKRHEKDVSLYSQIVQISGDELELIDVLKDCDQTFIDRIETESICSELLSIILNVLNSKEKIALLYKIAGILQPKIGQSLGVSQSYVSRLIARARKNLKQSYYGETQYKEVFKMAITDNLYSLSFSSKDVKNFNKIFAKRHKCR